LQSRRPDARRLPVHSEGNLVPNTDRQSVTRKVLIFFTLIVFISTIVAPLSTLAADPSPSPDPSAAASPSDAPDSTEPPAPSDAPSAAPSAEPEPSDAPAPSADPLPSTPPSIASDLADYPPGGLVTLSGANWQPGEAVHIFVNDDAGSTWFRNVDVVADEAGTIGDQFNLPNWFVAQYSVTATGDSGVARTTFTDAVSTTTSLASSPNPSADGSSATFTATVTCSASCTFPSGSAIRFVEGANGGCNGGTVLATDTTLTGTGSSRQGAVSTSSLTAGDHSIRACFDTGSTSGSNAQSSVSSPITHTVSAADTTTDQPTLLTPNNNAITGDSTPTFDWSDVADPSTPVTYTLQYAAKGTTCDLASPSTLTGLTLSTFTPGSSIGADGLYCWRVKALDGLGNDSGFTTAFEFRLDTTKPAVAASATKADSTPYAANSWTNQNVSVAFTCTDTSGSGLSINTVSADNTTLSAETATGSVTGHGSRCIDNAGNQADDVTFTPIKIDKTAPVITDLGPMTAANVNGWYNDDVINRFRAVDALSGVSAACATSFPDAPSNSQSRTTSGEGTAVQVTSNSCTDQAGNTAVGLASTNFKVDKTSPAITNLGPTTSANGAGWYKADVVNGFRAVDGLSGVDAACATAFPDAPANTQSKTTSGEGTTVHVSSDACSDLAGNTATAIDSADFKIDKAAPIISVIATTADHATYTAGTWANQSVTVSFFCGDGGSGVDVDNTSADGGTLSTDTATGSFSSAGSHCVDVAGNAASGVSFSPIKIDTGVPVITVLATNADASAYLADTWTNQDVSVGFSCSDGSGSGLATDTVADDNETLTDETAVGSVSSAGAHCVDFAGNAASDVTFNPIKIDKTAPLITDEGATTGANANLWYNHDVTNEFHVSDALSGINAACALAFNASSGSTQFVTSSGQGSAVHVTSAACTDLAGNTTDGLDSADFQIDQTAPSILNSGPTSGPNGNGWYKTDVVNGFQAIDTLSGVDADCAAAFPGLPAHSQTKTTSGEGTVHVTSDPCTDLAGNTTDGIDSADFQIDQTAPVLTNLGPTTAANGAGWYKTDVVNRFQATDALSGVNAACATNFPDAPTYTQSKTTSGEGTTVHVSSDACTDLAGNIAAAISSANFKIDKTAPLITDEGATTGANANLWYNHDVTNEFHVSDALSGINAACALAFNASSGSTQFVTSSGQGSAVHVTSAACTDLAGNTTDGLDSADFQIDQTAPSILNSGPTSGPNGNGWYKTDVVNGFQAIDTLSGVDADCAAAFPGLPAHSQTKTTSGEGTVHVTSDPCTDLAGNTTDGIDSADFQIDQTAPVLTNLGPTTAANGAGWYKTDVVNRFQATDALSGVNAACATNFPDAPTYTQSKTTSGEGTTVHVSSDACTDLAGNIAAAISSANFKIDKTAPNVQVGSPSTGLMTIALMTSVTGTVGDTLSGVSSLSVNGVQATVSAGAFTAANVTLNCGSNTLTAFATDVAGNTKTDGITVTRTCFGNLQYYQPIDQTTSTPVVNTGKFGRVIPTKVTFKLDDGTTVTDAVAAARGWTIQIGINGATCSNGTALDSVEAYADAGNSNAGTNVFRWTTSQWIYNLDTGAAPGVSMAINSCYRLDVYVHDGTNKVKISTVTYALFKPTK
jgi:hypothetical protein